jgi:hypothetical protein
MTLCSKLPFGCLLFAIFLAGPAIVPAKPAAAQTAQMPSAHDVVFRRYRGEDEVDDDRSGSGRGGGRDKSGGGSDDSGGSDSGGGNSDGGGKSKSDGGSSGGNKPSKGSSTSGDGKNKQDDSDRF